MNSQPSMINLLPEKEKKELALEKTGKKISILLGFAIIAFVFLIIILSCLRISLHSQVDTIKSLSANQEQLLQSADFLNFKQTINKTNRNLSDVEKFEQRQISVVAIIENILTFKNTALANSIYLTNFSFEKIFQKEKKKPVKIFAKVSVKGVANKREDLFFFKKELETITDIEKLYFSPYSWVEPIDAPFSFSLKTLCQ